MRRILFTLLCSIAGCLAASLTTASAASLSFSAAPVSGQSSVYEIRLLLDMSDAPMNAVEGTVSIVEGDAQITQTATGGSTVNLWVEQPTVQEGRVRFSGVTPGGFAQTRSYILSTIVKTRGNGPVVIGVTDAAGYLHDGDGTRIALNDTTYRIDTGTQTLPSRQLTDTTPPAPFPVRIAEEPLLDQQNGSLFFVAEDKESGIDRYEMLLTVKQLSDEEVRAAQGWVVAESPFELPETLDARHVYIKAVDKGGNVTYSHIALTPYEQPQVPAWAYVLLITPVVVASGVMASIFFVRKP